MRQLLRRPVDSTVYFYPRMFDSNELLESFLLSEIFSQSCWMIESVSVFKLMKDRTNNSQIPC